MSALVAPAERKQDLLAHALCAAELNEPFDVHSLPIRLLRELFDSIPRLRASVPYATLQLLARLVDDRRAEVRNGVADALPWLGDLYPARVEALLRRLLPE
jgi:hypothetical protein